MNIAPLPHLSSIFKSFFLKSIKNTDLLNPWSEGDLVAGLLSKSSWSFAMVCLWRQNKSGKKRINVWVPEYFCEQSLSQMCSVGSEIWYYPINEDLTPNLSGLKALNESERPDIIIAVHYFGRPNKLSPICDFAKINGAWVIEDAAHVLRPIKGVGNFGDFITYSPHKHLAMRNGSILLISKRGPSKLDQKLIENFNNPDSWSHTLESQIKSTSSRWREVSRDYIWLLKRVIQKIGYLNSLKVNVGSKKKGEKYNRPEISNLSKKFLFLEGKKLDLINFERHQNQLILDGLVMKLFNFGIHSLAPPGFERSNGHNWTNYMCGYKFKADDIKEIIKKLQDSNLAPSMWPDLPEVVTSNDNSIAGKIFHSRIFLSNHNRISKSDISKIYSSDEYIKKINLEVETQVIDLERWSELINGISKISYFQEDYYGNIKSKCEGWKSIKILFLINGSPIAIAQLLQKNKFNIIKVRRINRGPILLRDLTHSELDALWRSIAKLGNIFKLQVLSIAPELCFDAYNLALLNRNGLIKIQNKLSISSTIDLTLSVEILRKKLKSKWRLLLNESEKSSLSFVTSNTKKSYHDALNFYEQFRTQKGFDGPKMSLLKNLASVNSESSRIITFECKFNGKLEAVVCILLNRDTATYIIGGSIGEARANNASYKLIWDAILHAKAIGASSFDMGGIDFLNNPGVARFKSGLSGDEYMLVGEFISF